jgi:hypothetical protein
MRLVTESAVLGADEDARTAHVEVALGFLERRTVLVPVEGWEEVEALQTLVLKRGRRGDSAWRCGPGRITSTDR